MKCKACKRRTTPEASTLLIPVRGSRVIRVCYDCIFAEDAAPAGRKVERALLGKDTSR